VAKVGTLYIPGSPPSWGFDVPLATALCKTFLLRMLNDSWAGRNPTKVVVPIEEEGNDLHANRSPREPMVRGSAARTVHGKIILRASGFRSRGVPFFGATPRAQQRVQF
jgi:hypothetical protein